MDLTSIAVISLFAAALAGGLIGLLIGWRTRFEFGLSVGLLVFGGVALWFAGRCYFEYDAFGHAGANALWGEVIKIEEIPVGERGSQTAPLVRFSAPDNTVHPVLGPRLKQCSEIVLAVEDRTVGDIFGAPDDQKFWTRIALDRMLSIQ